VLIIEDDPLAAEVLQMLLEVDGHEVHVAHDGERGIELVDRHRPDIALVDLGLPGIDGYEVARRLRATGEKLYLVALTGFGGHEDRVRAFEAGFDVHFLKPGEPGDLARVVASSIRVQTSREPSLTFIHLPSGEHVPVKRRATPDNIANVVRSSAAQSRGVVAVSRPQRGLGG
jgi:DNA-binding response OmpR family regulator